MLGCLVIRAVGLTALLALAPLALLSLPEEGERRVRGDSQAPGAQPAMFKITTRRADDAVAVRPDKGRVMFDVTSPFGISQAVVERVGEAWPEAVGLRLHLKGLSNLRVSAGKVRLDAAVSIEEGKTRVRLWKDGKEDALVDEKSPLWMEVRVLDREGKPARELPLKDGYFEMTLSRALFADNPKTLTVGWIDFYRN
jgi:hypothetical protein